MTNVVNYLLLISVMSLLLGVGLRTAFTAVLDVVKQYQLVLRGVAANFLVVPFVFSLALQGAPLGPDVVIGLLILAAVPVAPLAPPFVGMAKGNLPYAVGLMLIVAFLCVPLTPLILALCLPTSAEGVEIDPLKIIQTLLTAQLIPLGLGMTINQVKPAWAKTLLQFVPKIGQVGLISSVALIIATQAQQIIDLGVLPHLVILLAILVCVLIGEVMTIGEADEIRRALTISTAIRNVALGLLIVSANYPGTPAVAIVIVFGMLSLGVGFVYGKLRTGSDAQSAEA